jgi:hypothetical protein
MGFEESYATGCCCCCGHWAALFGVGVDDGLGHGFGFGGCVLLMDVEREWFKIL